MSKSLNEMSLEELWQLFPISLVDYKEEWKQWYEREAKKIISLIPQGAISRISHIGSTAIPHIRAKNIVDILLEVGQEEDLLIVKNLLLADRWLCMSQCDTRISMNKGYTEKGFAEKVFHLHVRILGDNDELYFRDYLLENSEIARNYERLKLSLWKLYEYDRDKYTEAKKDFVEKYTDISKKEYHMKYRRSDK